MKKGRLTGYFDHKGVAIREGDLLRTGMRRGDPKGWTLERVYWSGKEWFLSDVKTGEMMQFQYDERLREVVKQ